MQRYLTPSKIVLLTLIKIYCDGSIPYAHWQRVLSLIASHLLPDLAKPLTRVQEERLSSTETNSSLGELELGLDFIVYDDNKQTLWQYLIERLRLLRNIDNLFELFSDLGALFVKDSARQTEAYNGSNKTHLVTLTETSLIGLFVRRCRVEFERLQFDEVMKLWREYELFCDPVLQLREQSATEKMLLGSFNTATDISEAEKLNEITNKDVSEIIDRVRDTAIEKTFGSSRIDVDRMLEFQIARMQETGCRLPKSIKQRFEDIIKSSRIDSPLVYYTQCVSRCPNDPELNNKEYPRFLNAWYSGDYSSSFQHLHQYYDYAMHSKDRSQYQYALLNMGILQADFGCYEEAVAAMRETMAVAKENQDLHCLNFCLSWLEHFQVRGTVMSSSVKDTWTISTPDNNLGYLKRQAAELKMWSLLSSTLLNEARLYLSRGRKPLEALGRIYQSSSLNIVRNLPNLVGVELMVRSSFFGRLGVTNLAAANYALITDCYHRSSVVEDSIRARCRSAEILSLSGRYAQADKLIDTCQPDAKTALKLEQALVQHQRMIRFRRAMHQGETQLAEDLLEKLKNAPSPDNENRIQLALFEVEYLIRMEDYSAASKLVDTLLERMKAQNSDIYYRIKLLSAKASLFAKIGRSQKGFSLALRATTAALRTMNLYALWEAIAVLGDVLVSMGMHKAAVQILDASVYLAMETEDQAVVALLQTTLADARLGLALDVPKGARKPAGDSTELQRALDWVNAAYKSFERLNDSGGMREMTEKRDLIHQSQAYKH